VTHPFAPPLDPPAVGVGVVVADAIGHRLVDVAVPGGLWDPATRTGWKAPPGRGRWRYVNRSAAPPGGITDVTIKDLSARRAGLVQFGVTGRRSAYAVDPATLPLTALLVLDPPTAETGQCGRASFAGPASACSASPRAVRCD